jgi:hypothetical protein
LQFLYIHTILRWLTPKCKPHYRVNLSTQRH